MSDLQTFEECKSHIVGLTLSNGEPRFPMLRKPCPREAIMGTKAHRGACKRCHGLGYVPSNRLEDWMDAISGKRFDIIGFGGSYIVRLHSIYIDTRYEGVGKTLLEAVARALLEACHKEINDGPINRPVDEVKRIEIDVPLFPSKKKHPGVKRLRPTR